MKLPLSLFAFTLALTLGIALTGTGCAQNSIPAPRTLSESATAPALPTVKTTPAFPRPLNPPPADPELSLADFQPGQGTIYSSVLVRGSYIAMTFDDGPHAEFTPKLLDQLKARNIKATFFVVGQNVAAHPQIARRIVDEGHEIANHSWSHPAFAKMSNEAVSSQIQRTEDAIFSATGLRSTNFRPPYGSISAAQKKWVPQKFKLRIVLWSVDPLDWRKPGDAVLRSRIVNGAHDGAIILAHDIHGTTVRAMPETFDELLAKGFKFVTVEQLLALEIPKAAPTRLPSPSPIDIPATAPALP